MIRFDHVKLAENKNIYLFFEIHDPWTILDSQQLGYLAKVLALRDRLGRPPMHLMVEVPSWLAQKRAHKQKVTYDVIECVAPCPSIHPEDVEIRCQSLAAYYVLNKARTELDQDSLSGEQFNAGASWCRVGDITVETVLREFETHISAVCPDLDRLCLSRHAFYVSKLGEIRATAGNLRACLEKINAKPNERIIDLAKRLQGLPDLLIKKFKIQVAISDYGSHIFDLHILRKILMSQYDHCMIIAGNAHSEWICNAMEHLNARYQVSEGAGSVPLEEHTFNRLQVSLNQPL